MTTAVRNAVERHRRTIAAGGGGGGSLYDFVLWNSSRQLQAYSFDGTDIAAVGNASSALTISSADRGGVSALSTSTVVVAGSDGFNNREMGKYTFDGTDWTLEGNILTLGTSFITPAGVGANRAALVFTSSPGLQGYDFDGSDWATVGNANSGCIGRYNCALAADQVATIVAGTNQLSICTFDGSDWNETFTTSLGFTSRGMCAMDSDTVAVWNITGGQLRTYEKGASTFQQVGNSLSISGLGNVSMAALSATRIVIGSNALGTLQAYDWDGSDWAAVGNSLGSVAVPEYDNMGNGGYLLI